MADFPRDVMPLQRTVKRKDTVYLQASRDILDKSSAFIFKNNTSRPAYIYMRHGTGSPLVQVMVAKLLHEQMMTYCQIYPEEQASMLFHLKYKNKNLSTNWNWQWRVQNTAIL